MKLDRVTGIPTPKQLLDHQWVTEQYVAKRRSTPSIAAELGCAAGTVLRWVKHHGIAPRSRGSERGHDRCGEAARHKMSVAKRDMFIGENNPNWRGGIALKDPDRNRYPAKMWTKQVKDRDGWKCQKCGSTDRLHAHHIKRWCDYPELRYEVSNGITLCHPCHEAAHGQGYKFRWPTKKAEKPTSASALVPQG